MMLGILPALHNTPGLEATEEDVLLRKPAVLMKPLCMYRG